MSGGALTKEAKEMFLKKDIEHHRQRTLDNKNFIPKEKELCKCGHHKNYHIDKEPFLGGCSHIIDGDKFYCCCAEFTPKFQDNLDNHNWIDEKDCFNSGFNKGYTLATKDVLKEVEKGIELAELNIERGINEEFNRGMLASYKIMKASLKNSQEKKDEINK